MARRSDSHAAAAVALGGLLLSACIASNVVATQDRLVERPLAELAFAPALELRLAGLWASIEITGDAAVSLRKVYYWFAADGTYTAAALADGDAGLTFQTLGGTWATSADGLSLDGAPPVRLEQAPDHLRITAPNGGLVLRREVAQ
jgi:hypothetical protein